jgi:uncharacterized secreted protein with C-terminal beta-propeller domain
MNANNVGARYPDSFGNFALSNVQPVYLGATGNAVTTLATVGTTYIVRRVTVANASGSVALANVTILTSNDGNTSNAVTNAAALTTVTSSTKFQDLALSTAAASTIYSGALYVYVGTAAAANNSVEITVYGDVVTL